MKNKIKRKLIFRRDNKIKYKIVLEGSEEPVVYNGVKMEFRTKGSMLRMFKEISEKYFENKYEWIII